MPMLRSKLEKLLRVKYFQVLIQVYFLLLLSRYIHLVSTDVYMDNIPSYKGLLENQNQKCVFFIVLSSCENWVSQIFKILIRLDSSRRYDLVEVLHAYVTIEIKEVRFCGSVIL